jgi:hypothetical protein
VSLSGSNERVEHGISPLPDAKSSDLETYLQNQASDGEMRQLLYNYIALKDQPGIKLFKYLPYVASIDWENRQK